MPHITIEHSANVAAHHDVAALVTAVHEAALAHGLPEVTGLRTRAAERAHFRVATGDARFAFVAIHCRIGPGREPAAKQAFIAEVLDAAESELAGTPLAIAWSIELTELDPELRINRNRVRSAMEADDEHRSAMEADRSHRAAPDDVEKEA